MLLAQQDSRPLIEFTLAPLLQDHGLPLAVMGVLVVFSALVLIAVFIKLLPYVFGEDRRLRPAASAGLAAGHDGLSEEMLVVIAAAVAETIRQPHRIVHVRGLTTEDLEWSLGGRMQHHLSHNLPRRDRR